MKKPVLIAAVGGLIVFMIILNVVIMSQMKDKPKPAPVVFAVEEPVEHTVRREKPKGIFTQKEWLDMNREYRECVIYADGTEVARFKINVHNHKMFDRTGEIPDETIPFEDIYSGVTGTVTYHNNLRHGPYVELFDNKRVAKEMYFYRDKIRTLKEYFYDGRVRMDVDYTDAIVAINDPEVGVGKVYARDGVLKYEWNLTNTNPNRYKKSYNIDGQLVETMTFDSYGKMLERKRF